MTAIFTPPAAITVSDKANHALSELAREDTATPIRIFLKFGGCGMHSFGITAEPATSDDLSFYVGGYHFVIESRLVKAYAPIHLDSDGYSFRISGGGIHPPLGCGTCAYGCGARGGTRCTGKCQRCANPCPTGIKLQAKSNRRKVYGMA